MDPFNIQHNDTLNHRPLLVIFRLYPSFPDVTITTSQTGDQDCGTRCLLPTEENRYLVSEGFILQVISRSPSPGVVNHNVLSVTGLVSNFPFSTKLRYHVRPHPDTDGPPPFRRKRLGVVHG